MCQSITGMQTRYTEQNPSDETNCSSRLGVRFWDRNCCQLHCYMNNFKYTNTSIISMEVNEQQ